MKRARAKAGIGGVIGAAALVLAAAAAGADPAWTPLDQGSAWTADARADFYSRDQGSRIMPLRWMFALQQPDGTAFMADSLARYGYLPNEDSTPPGLPVGFTAANDTGGTAIGMTCSACHTRQIIVQGKAYRVDGGPGIVDFQGFLSDLDAAVGATLDGPARFDAFAQAVLGAGVTPDQAVQLHKDLADWYLPFHTIVKGALPQPPWGPGRLDAVTMIFNRLSGLDIGAAPPYIIEANIQRADAPVRYPFLWNASRQDKTQWPGFADNGNDLLSEARNLGEVTGVFAIFHPKKDDSRILGIDYVAQNSANIDGLKSLEGLIRRIGAPRWPWPINKQLAAQGSALFAQNCAKGCHEIAKGARRSLKPIIPASEQTWLTPVQNVHTDTREWAILDRKVDPGVLTGAQIPGLDAPLQNPEAPIKVLGMAVTGTIIQHILPVIVPEDVGRRAALVETAIKPAAAALKDAFRYTPAAPTSGSYESRVLQGIWAAAPYLHNGSVASLAELLKPAAERMASFSVGPQYDLVNVGVATGQTAFAQPRQTTGCEDTASGNSRCGHEFGTKLSPAQKQALIEYLKTL